MHPVVSLRTLAIALATSSVVGLAQEVEVVPEVESPARRLADLVSTEQGTGDWLGGRTWLVDRGISIDLSLVVDYSRQLRGGIRYSDAFRHLLSFGAAIETEPLFGWEGGTLFIGFQTLNGRNGSEFLTGDLQGIGNIDADGLTQLSELWYEQRALDEKLRIKLGKVDANSEFAYVENGLEFINSSPGCSPTILGFPTYPDPATSVNVFLYPNESLYLGVGIYDGATQHGGYGRTGNRGPSTFLGEPSDLFLIGEAGIKWTVGTLPGRLGIGAWRHTGDFDRFDGGSESGTSGFYAVLDQRLWAENPGDEEDTQGIGLFAQYGYADKDVSEVEHHLSLGATWTGAIATRDEDVIGAMVSYVRVSDEAGAGFVDSSETAIELFYKVQLAPWLSVKPDLQYIINPGATGERDAVVGTIRIEAIF